MERISLNRIREEIACAKPIIHSITNPISINQCANAVLSLGARPTMAEHPKEIREITSCASAILLNLGNITDARIKSMGISLKVANKRNINSVLDLVGISGSKFRRKLALRLFKRKPTIIKGNYSEIYSACHEKYYFAGVDGDNNLSTDEVIKCAKTLAQKTGSIILASGKSDIVTDSKKVSIINNGCGQLAKITGTGCLLGATCATFLSVLNGFESAVFSCALLGICGEISKNNKGNGTFLLNLMDKISTITEEEFLEKIKVESYEEF